MYGWFLGMVTKGKLLTPKWGSLGQGPEESSSQHCRNGPQELHLVETESNAAGWNTPVGRKETQGSWAIGLKWEVLIFLLTGNYVSRLK